VNCAVLGAIVENLFSVKDAAKKLGGISPWTIYSWLSKGKIRRVKIGSRTLIAESELVRLVQGTGQVQATADEQLVEPRAHTEARPDGNR